MKENEFVVLIGTNVILVPYEDYHVPKYHNWMQDPELQTLTASERLSLQEEYSMQRSWREDADKCTFIVLDREKFDASKSTKQSSNVSSTKRSAIEADARGSTEAVRDDCVVGSNMSSSEKTSHDDDDDDDVEKGSRISTPQQREVDAMIGDVNLFFIDDDDDDEDAVCESDAMNSACNERTNSGLGSNEARVEETRNNGNNADVNFKECALKDCDSPLIKPSRPTPKLIAEAELMIADSSFRGRGRGKESLLLLLHYGVAKLGVKKFVAKIGAENAVSRNLFAKIGFSETKFNAVFQEVTMKAMASEKTFEGVVGGMAKNVVMVTRRELHCEDGQ